MLLIGDFNDTPYNDTSSIVAVNASTGAWVNAAFLPQYSGIDAITAIDVVSAVPEPSWAACAAAGPRFWAPASGGALGGAPRSRPSPRGTSP